MLISKYSGQDACCLHVLMDCIFQEHCLAQTDGSWTLKLGPLAPCHPTVHPDWMPGTPIDFSTVCHAKSGRLGRRMQELHKHFPWQFQIAKQINILVQWFPGSHLACGFLDASWSLWIRVKQDPALCAWKLCIQRWVLTATRDAVPCFVQHLQDKQKTEKKIQLACHLPRTLPESLQSASGGPCLCSRPRYGRGICLFLANMGWGGVGWDVNVHVTLMMLRCSWGLGWGGVGC